MNKQKCQITPGSSSICNTCPYHHDCGVKAKDIKSVAHRNPNEWIDSNDNDNDNDYYNGNWDLPSLEPNVLHNMASPPPNTPIFEVRHTTTPTIDIDPNGRLIIPRDVVIEESLYIKYRNRTTCFTGSEVR